MSYYLAGLAAVHLAEDITGPRRAVLIGLASFVPDSERSAPLCFASRASVGKRAGLSVRAVHEALRAHEAAGLIVRDGTVTRGGSVTTVRWRLPFLAEVMAAHDVEREARKRR